MNRVNFLLHNHGPVRHSGAALEPLVNYFWRTLGALGFDVTVTDDKLEREAVNVYFEYFLDERLLHKLFAIKRNYGVRVGVVATELIIANDIPYLRDGSLHVDPGSGRQATLDETAQASRLRVTNLLTHAASFDFTWSLLDRTHALMLRHNPRSYLFPIGYLPPQRPAARVPKDIDVLFFGALTPRRAAFVEEVRAARLNVVCIGRNTEIGYVPEFMLDSYIDRAKIVLNLTFADDMDGTSDSPKFASCGRVPAALSRGALVVSEAIPQDNPYEPFLVSCGRADLPRRCAEIVAGGTHAELAARNFARFKETMAAEIVDAPAVEILRTL